MNKLQQILFSGIWLTAHDTTSGQYFARAHETDPTGWHHATFRAEHDTLLMRGENGAEDWAFATLQGKDIKLHDSLVGKYTSLPFTIRERVSVAARVVRYILGRVKRLPDSVEVKAPAPCAACGRKLTAGASLTLQEGPNGMGFYGKQCASRGGERASAHKAGLSAMDELIRRGKLGLR